MTTVVQHIQIIVNGEPQTVQAGLRISDLVSQWELNPQRLAIEYNWQILTRALWPETAVKEGDRLEIVHFVGGG